MRFAEMREGDITLLPAGRRYAQSDVDERKQLFAQHLLRYVPLVSHIRRVLDDRPGRTAPARRFRDELEDFMSESDAAVTLDCVTQWGRYAELFAYDEGLISSVWTTRPDWVEVSSEQATVAAIHSASAILMG